MENDGFTLVTRRKQPCRVSNNKHLSHQSTHRAVSRMPRPVPSGFTYKGRGKVARNTEPTLRSVLAELEERRQTIRRSDFFAKLCGQLAVVDDEAENAMGSLKTRGPLVAAAIARPMSIFRSQIAEMRRDAKQVDCVCYGIGSVSTSRTSQFQFVLLLLLREAFQLAGQIFIFDPIMSDLDHRIAESCNFSVIEENERAARSITAPTLFYMPHCGHTLYNNLLRANWSPRTLPDILVVGNSFDAYSTLQTAIELASKATYLYRAARIVEEQPFPDGFMGGDVFNNTSLHMFGTRVSTMDMEFWEMPEIRSVEEDPEVF